jgi:hypothetical protein
VTNRSRPEAASETTAKLSSATLPHPGNFSAFRHTQLRMFENVDPWLYQRNHGTRERDLHCRVCGCFHRVVDDRCCCEPL